MENMLLKMARQLNAYDEASLMALWEKYAALVENFEPSQRWEEANLVFSLIQAVHLKNQLFNQRLAASAALSQDRKLPGMDAAKAWLDGVHRADAAVKGDLHSEDPSGRGRHDAGADAVAGHSGKVAKRCKVLHFRRRKSDKPL